MRRPDDVGHVYRMLSLIYKFTPDTISRMTDAQLAMYLEQDDKGPSGEDLIRFATIEQMNSYLAGQRI